MVTTSYTKEQMQQIGERIKLARRAKHLNQGQLCYRARIPSTKIVSKFELGLDVPKDERLTLIAKALDVTEDYILKGETMAMSSVPKKPEVAKETSAPVIVKPNALPEASSPQKKGPLPAPLSDYVWPNGKVLRELRQKNKLSSMDIAEMLELDGRSKTLKQARISTWELSKSRMPKTYLEKLAVLYSVPVDSLIDTTKPPMNRPEVYDKTTPKNFVEHIENMRKERELKETKAMERINTNTEIVVTGPEMIDISERPVPKNAEQVFAKNVKAYLTERNIDVAEFEKELGAEEGYLDIVIKHNPKIPLHTAINISRRLGKSIEELATDTKALEIEKQIEELEKKMAALKASIGM